MPALSRLALFRAFERCRDVCQLVENFVLSIAIHDFQSTTVARSCRNASRLQRMRAQCMTRYVIPWSTAHEDPILTPSVTDEDARENKDMHKRVSACSAGLPLSTTRIVHCGVRNIENAMTAAPCMKRRRPRHIEIDARGCRCCSPPAVRCCNTSS